MMSENDLRRELAALEKMSAGELQIKYRELFGDEVRTKNRQWLFRRCAWRLQALVVNQAEAKQVRTIYEKYLELGSLLAVARWLDAQNWRNKRYETKKGTLRGGKDFDKSTLQKLLTNRLYLGKITYKGQVYEGEHEAIVDEDLFGRAQGMLRRNRGSGGKHQRNKYGALLKGLVRCRHCGCAMSHHWRGRRVGRVAGRDGQGGKGGPRHQSADCRARATNYR